MSDVSGINRQIVELRSQIAALEEIKTALADSHTGTLGKDSKFGGPIAVNPTPDQRGPATTSTHIHTGPRGGKFHYSPSGRKVYEKRSR